MIYEIFLINGRLIVIEADEIEFEDGMYKFYLDSELVGEFNKNNIAGYYRSDREEFFGDEE